jgi:hypothetical protein
VLLVAIKPIVWIYSALKPMLVIMFLSPASALKPFVQAALSPTQLVNLRATCVMRAITPLMARSLARFAVTVQFRRSLELRSVPHVLLEALQQTAV